MYSAVVVQEVLQRRRSKKLEDEEHNEHPSEGDSNQLRAIMESGSLITTWKVAREVNINHSMAIWRWKQTGKVKKLDKWVPQELTANQRNRCFEESFSFILPYNNKPFLDQIVMCNEKWILCDNHWWPAQCLDEEEAPKYFQMPNLHQKISWSLFGSLMPIWYTPAIWILVKPLHLRSMLSQSKRCTEHCNTYSQHWSTERAQFFSTTKPNHILHNQCYKSWTSWAMKLYLICHIHLTTHQPSLPQASQQLFARKMLP